MKDGTEGGGTEGGGGRRRRDQEPQLRAEQVKAQPHKSHELNLTPEPTANGEKKLPNTVL